jgi:hypothetical protein
VAVEDGGAAIFDVALRRLEAEKDGAVRGQLLAAIARARDPALVARAQALDLAADRPVSELLFVSTRQASIPALEQVGWDAFRRGADKKAERNPAWAPFQPQTASRFCDAARLAEVRSFFGPRAERLPAMARPLAESIESIELCIAAVAAQREGFDAVLAAGAPRSP